MSQSSETICRHNNNMRWEPAAQAHWLPLVREWWAAVTVSCADYSADGPPFVTALASSSAETAGFPDYLIACKSSLKLPIHHKSYGEYHFQSERCRERKKDREMLELWWAISDVKRLWIVTVSFSFSFFFVFAKYVEFITWMDAAVLPSDKHILLSPHPTPLKV